MPMKIAPAPPELIGQAPAFLDALAHASRAAALDRPLLIVGERGAGKELFAGRIHFLSSRWDGPLVKVNCAAMNDELLDSELFGHEAGAFTGASKRHAGRFERADGGTLFLDEIASASARVQEKLLRVIEYGEYERVGGEETLMADVRIVAAANVDLRERAARDEFRADLLDRLAFDVIAAPPLRARAGDVALLAAHFAAAIAHEMDAPFDGFTPRAMATLSNHHWPGNVRELKNAAERSYYRWRGGERTGPIDDVVIDPFPDFMDSAPPATSASNTPLPPTRHVHQEQAPETIDLRDYLDTEEERLSRAALVRHGWSQTRAARALGLTYDQMRGIVRKYALAEKKSDAEAPPVSA